MAKYEVRIKGSVRYRLHSSGTSSVNVDETIIVNDYSGVRYFHKKEHLEHWARSKYANVTQVNLRATSTKIEEENKRVTKTNNDTETSGGSWGCFAILKPVWWIFKLIRWIFR